MIYGQYGSEFAESHNFHLYSTGPSLNYDRWFATMNCHINVGKGDLLNVIFPDVKD
jgi:hypothetical protein